MRNLFFVFAFGLAAVACHPTHKTDSPPYEPTGTTTGSGTPSGPGPTPVPQPVPTPNSISQDPNVAPLPPPETDEKAAEFDVPISQFDKLTFQVTAKTLKKYGIFVNDPNGKYGHSFFIVPDLIEKGGHLSLQVGENEYIVGVTNAPGVANARTGLCRKEHEACRAYVKTLYNVMTELVFEFPTGEIVSYNGNDDF